MTAKGEKYYEEENKAILLSMEAVSKLIFLISNIIKIYHFYKITILAK
jgi:hypothetical protein